MGLNAGRSYRYNHDEVYKNTFFHYSELDCWKNRGYFSNPKNIPAIAQQYVTEIF